MTEKMTSKKVTIKELVAYLWKEGDITTNMPRNEQEDVDTMVRICAIFDPVADFINAFSITAVEQVYEIRSGRYVRAVPEWTSKIRYRQGACFFSGIKSKI